MRLDNTYANDLRWLQTVDQSMPFVARCPSCQGDLPKFGCASTPSSQCSPPTSHGIRLLTTIHIRMDRILKEDGKWHKHQTAR